MSRAGAACRASPIGPAIRGSRGFQRSSPCATRSAIQIVLWSIEIRASGTRILIDKLLGSARPEGYRNQPRSHNAVAAAIAQGRADWGVTIEPVAKAAGLAFIPLAEENYDFALVSARRDRPAVRAFLEELRSPETREALVEAGFRPS